MLFLIYINDLHTAIKHSNVIHFADDTSLINCNKSLKTINLQINEDLKLLCEWLRANKICLNTNKTEIIIFRSKQKSTISKKLNFRISGQKIKPSLKVTYLGVVFDQFLTWNDHFNILLPKLSRATGMLAKIRYFVPYETLCSIYHAIFNSHLTYSSLIWGYITEELKNRIQVLQNKALRIIHFKKQRESAGPLYFKSNILPINDQIKLQHCLLALDHQRKLLPTAFRDFFVPIHNIHKHKTKSAVIKLNVPGTKTKTCGTFSIKTQAAICWNTIIPSIQICLFNSSKSLLKKKLQEILINKHNQ